MGGAESSSGRHWSLLGELFERYVDLQLVHVERRRRGRLEVFRGIWRGVEGPRLVFQERCGVRVRDLSHEATSSSGWVRDLTGDGDVEENPGPGAGPSGGLPYSEEVSKKLVHGTHG
jgi:hypothetical protein